MSNQIITKEECRKNITNGVNLMGDTVSISLGARGRQVGIDYGYEVKSIRDGVKIARSVFPENKGELFAVRTILQAANKQVSSVGDGTTVVCLLAQAIYNECIKNIAAGTNPMSLVKGLEEGRDILLEALEKQSIPVKTKEQAIRIAKISAQDEELGQQIGEAIFDLGVEGVVTTDESPTGKTYVELQEGLQFENGYLSPAFVTDVDRMEATVENTKILLTDKEINNVQDLLPLMEKMLPAGLKSLVVICGEMSGSGSALPALIVNKLRGNMNLLAVKAPYVGQAKKDFLEDIAILTGGRVISIDSGERLENIALDDLGSAYRITATEKATMIVVDQETRKKQEKAIKDRVKSLKALMEREEGSDYAKEKLKERYAKLQKGIAVVKVGAPTEIEMKNWIERADDAIKATQAALKEGFVAGGEIVFLQLRKSLHYEDLNGKDQGMSMNPSIAQHILYNALEKPFAKLLENAGLKPDTYLEKVTDKLGVDVTDGKVKDMIEAGIIDPTLVALESIKNAISVASILMVTEVLILPIEEKKNGQS